MVYLQRSAPYLSWSPNRLTWIPDCIHRFVTVTVAVYAAFSPVDASAQQKFPSKPVRFVVAYTAGSQADTVARMIGQKMSESWEQPVVVDNRPGGGGTLAPNIVAKAVPDGHTLLQASSNFTISAAMQPSLPYDPFKDFIGAAQIGFGTTVLVVTPALGVKSVKDLIALAKAQPGKIIFGSPAIGSGNHLNGARLGMASGMKIVTVAFKGAPEAMIETLAGRTHFSIGSLVSALPFTRVGQLLPLAVFNLQRSPMLPDVPTMAETLPEFRRPGNSFGLLAPAGTPRPILNQINTEIARVFNLPDIKERMQRIGFELVPSTAEAYDKSLRVEIEELSKFVRDAGLRPK